MTINAGFHEDDRRRSRKRRNKAAIVVPDPFMRYANAFAIAVVMFANMDGRGKDVGQALLSPERSLSHDLWTFLQALLLGLILSHGWRRRISVVVSNADKNAIICDDRKTEPSARRTTAGNCDAVATASVSTAARANQVKFRASQRVLSLSAKEPFLSRDEISSLALSDITDVLRYTAEVNDPSFQRTRFLSGLRPVSRRAVDAIDAAIRASRGDGVRLSSRSPSSTSSSSSEVTGHGDVDALAFTAAARLYAEWRSLRLVPDGYKPYAVGMSMARRDLIQNVAKMEIAVHAWLKFHDEGSRNGGELEGPTIRQLVQHEIERKVHRKLPRLQDKSAASGLLWMMRQLHYQTEIFYNLSRVPESFPTSQAAVTAAYKLVYDKYHNFFIKQIFRTSIKAFPNKDVVCHYMNLPLTWEDDDAQSEVMTETDESEDEVSYDESWMDGAIEEQQQQQQGGPVAAAGDETVSCNPFQDFAQHIANEWEKFQSFIGQCGGGGGGVPRDACDSSRNAFEFAPDIPPSTGAAPCLAGVDVPAEVSCGTARADGRHRNGIARYLSVVQPILEDLDELVLELNINDPSRV